MDDTITIDLPTKIVVWIAQHDSLIEKHNIGRDAFYTTSLFWDCECEENFIHPVTHVECFLCKTMRDEQPNARVDEVLNHSNWLPHDLVQVVEVLADKICPHLNAIPF